MGFLTGGKAVTRPSTDGINDHDDGAVSPAMTASCQRQDDRRRSCWHGLVALLAVSAAGMAAAGAVEQRADFSGGPGPPWSLRAAPGQPAPSASAGRLRFGGDALRPTLLARPLGVDGSDAAPLVVDVQVAFAGSPRGALPALLALTWDDGAVASAAVRIDGGRWRTTARLPGGDAAAGDLDGRLTVLHLRLVLVTRTLTALASRDGLRWWALAAAPRPAGVPVQLVIGRGRAGAASIAELAVDAPPPAGKPRPLDESALDLTALRWRHGERTPAPPPAGLPIAEGWDACRRAGDDAGPTALRLGAMPRATPAAAIAAAAGTAAAWTAPENADGRFDLGRALARRDDWVAALAVPLTVAAASAQVWWFDAPRGGELWLDGAPVLVQAPAAGPGERSVLLPRLHGATLHLTAGEHLVVAIVPGRGDRGRLLLQRRPGDVRARLAHLDALIAAFPTEASRIAEAHAEAAALHEEAGEWAAAGGRLDAALAGAGADRGDLQRRRARLLGWLGDHVGATAALAAARDDDDDLRAELGVAATVAVVAGDVAGTPALRAGGDRAGLVAALTAQVLVGADDDGRADALIELADLRREAGLRDGAAALARRALDLVTAVDGLRDRAAALIADAAIRRGEPVAFDAPQEAAGLIDDLRRALVGADGERVSQLASRCLVEHGGALVRLGEDRLSGVGSVVAGVVAPWRQSAPPATVAAGDRASERALGADLARALSGDDESALAALAERLRASPLAAVALGRLAALARDRGRPALARAALARLLDEHPAAVTPLLLAAWADANARCDPAAAPAAWDRVAALTGDLTIAGRTLPGRAHADAQRARAATTSATWPDPGARGNGRGPQLPATLAVTWRAALGDTVREGPPRGRSALVADRLAILATSADCYAVDLLTGAPVWRSSSPLPQLASRLSNVAGPAVQAPARHGDLVIARLRRRGPGTPGAVLEARALADGALRWSTEQDGALAGLDVVSSPTVDGGLVYALARDAGTVPRWWVFALDAASGRLWWRTALAGGGGGPRRGDGDGATLPDEEHLPAPTVAAGALIVAPGLGLVARLDPGSGQVVWLSTYARSDLGDQRGAGHPLAARLPGRVLVSGGLLVLAPRDRLGALALRLRDGVVVWTRDHADAHELVGVVSAGDGDVVIAAGAAGVEAWDLASGRGRWRRPPGETAGTPLPGAVLAGDEIVVGGVNGLTRLRALDGSVLLRTTWADLGLHRPLADLVVLPGVLLGSDGEGLVRLSAATVAGAVVRQLLPNAPEARTVLLPLRGEIPYADRTIVADGDAADWAGLPSLALGDGARLRLAWDERALHLVVDSAGHVPRPLPPGAALSAHDGVALAIDGDDGDQGSLVVLQVAATSTGPVLGQVRGQPIRDDPRASVRVGAAVIAHGTGTRYEISLPWLALHLRPPAPGRELGFGLALIADGGVRLAGFSIAASQLPRWRLAAWSPRRLAQYQRFASAHGDHPLASDLVSRLTVGDPTAVRATLAAVVRAAPASRAAGRALAEHAALERSGEPAVDDDSATRALAEAAGVPDEVLGDALPVAGAGRCLAQWVWVDPAAPPQGLRLSFRSAGAGWSHRAGWGEVGAASGGCRRLGRLPVPGVWTRLVVPVAAVGLDDALVEEIGFACNGGGCWWGPTERSAGGKVTTLIADRLPDGAVARGDALRWDAAPGGRAGRAHRAERDGATYHLALAAPLADFRRPPAPAAEPVALTALTALTALAALLPDCDEALTLLDQADALDPAPSLAQRQANARTRRRELLRAHPDSCLADRLLVGMLPCDPPRTLLRHTLVLDSALPTGDGQHEDLTLDLWSRNGVWTQYVGARSRHLDAARGGGTIVDPSAAATAPTVQLDLGGQRARFDLDLTILGDRIDGAFRGDVRGSAVAGRLSGRVDIQEIERRLSGDAVLRAAGVADCRALIAEIALDPGRRAAFYDAWVPSLPHWRFLGWFDGGGPNNVGNPLGPEQGARIDFAAGWPGLDGDSARWSTVELDGRDLVLRGAGVEPGGKPEWPVGYFASRFTSPQRRPALLVFGWSGFASLRFNGDYLPVGSQGNKRFERDRLVVPVQLERGVNEILIKQAAHTGRGRAHCRVTALDGEPIELPAAW